MIYVHYSYKLYSKNFFQEKIYDKLFPYYTAIPLYFADFELPFHPNATQTWLRPPSPATVCLPASFAITAKSFSQALRNARHTRNRVIIRLRSESRASPVALNSRLITPRVVNGFSPSAFNCSFACAHAHATLGQLHLQPYYASLRGETKIALVRIRKHAAVDRGSNEEFIAIIVEL